MWEPPPPPACKHAPRSCPVAVACRIRSPRRCAYPRLCMLALWATPLEKTIFNRFLCANPPAGRLLCASVFAYLSAMIIAFLSVLLNFTVRLPEAKPPRCGRIPASRFDRGACLHAGGGGGSHTVAPLCLIKSESAQTFLHVNHANLHVGQNRLTLFFCACIMESEMQERREYIENHNSRKPEH